MTAIQELSEQLDNLAKKTRNAKIEMAELGKGKWTDEARDRWSQLKVEIENNDKATKKIKSTLTDLGGNSQTFLSSVNDITSQFGVNLTGLQGAITKVTSANEVMSKSLLASPLGWIAGIVAAIVLAFNTLKEALESTSEGQEVLNEVTGMFQGIITGLKQVVFDLIKPITDWLIKSGALQKALSSLSTVAGTLAGVISGVTNVVIGTVKSFGALGEAAVKLIKGDFSGAWDAAKNSVTEFKKGIDNSYDSFSKSIKTVKEATTVQGKYEKALKQSRDAEANSAIAKTNARDAAAKYREEVRKGTATEEDYQKTITQTKKAYDEDIAAKKKLLQSMKDLHAASNSTQDDILEEKKLAQQIAQSEKERQLAVNQVEQSHRTSTKSTKSSSSATSEHTKSTKDLTTETKKLEEEVIKLSKSFTESISGTKSSSSVFNQVTTDINKMLSDLETSTARTQHLLSGEWITKEMMNLPDDKKKAILDWVKKQLPKDADMSKIKSKIKLSSIVTFDTSDMEFMEETKEAATKYLKEHPIEVPAKVDWEGVKTSIYEDITEIENILAQGGIDFDSSTFLEGIDNILDGFDAMKKGGEEAVFGVSDSLKGLGSVLTVASQAYSSYINKQVADGKMSEKEGKKRLKESAKVQAAGTIATSIAASISVFKSVSDQIGGIPGVIAGGVAAAATTAAGVLAAQQILQAANGSVATASAPTITAPSYSMPTEVTGVTPAASGEISSSIDQSSAAQPVLVVESLDEVKGHMTQVEVTSTL